MGKFEGALAGSWPEVIIAEGDTVTIADAHLLFSGDFSRHGTDLVLTGEGQSVVVADYFGDAGMPTLASPAGAVLLPDVVSALAGPQAPGRFAQAGDLQPGEGIGSVVTLSGSATVQRSDGTVVDLGVDSRVAEGDVVQTGSGSALGIVFDDGTVFNLNADSRMVLNDMVYEPGGGSNSMLFSLVQGVFSFVAGQVAPTGEMRIDTPVATMGIRGTSGITKLETIDGVAVFRVVPDPVTNNVGTIVLFSPGTDIILVVMESSDSQWAIDTATGQVIEQPVDPGDADIIQQLHDTFIRFAGVPTEQDENQQQAGEAGGSGLQTQFALTSAEIATIVSLAEGALAQTESLDGEPSGSGDGRVSGSEPSSATAPLTPPPPAVITTDPASPIIVNDVPVAADDRFGDLEAPFIDENTVAVISAADLLANDSDADGDALTVIAVSGTSTLGATVTLNPDGSIVYDPRQALNDLASGDVVIDTFTYTLSDGRGGTAQASVSLAVAGVTDVAAGDDEVQTLEDTPVTFNVLANDTGAEGDVLSVGTFSTLSNPELGRLELLGDGTFLFTPALNASGTANFTYQATSGVELSEATVKIEVEPVADAPRLGVGQGLGIEGDDVTAWASLGDASLVTSHEGQVSTDGSVMVRLASSGVTEAEIESLLGLAPGALDASGNGDVTEGAGIAAELQVAAGDVISFDWNFGEKDYLPFRDYAFVATEGGLFKLAEVNDSVEDSEWTGWQTYSFVAPTTGLLALGFGVVDVDDASVDSELLIANLRHSSGQVEGVSDTAIALPIAASLVDNDGSENLSILIAGVPADAVLSAGTDNGDGTWTLTASQLANLSITPPPGSLEDFTLTVTATAREAANGDVATTSRTLDVVVHLAPVAGNDSFATDESTTVAGNVLANDSDPEGEPVSVTHVEGGAANVGAPIVLASGALLTLEADGTFTYDPNGQFQTLGAGASFEDSFLYTISDGQGGSDTATAVIEITGVNDAPEVEALAGSVGEDGPSFAVDLLTGAGDVDDGDIISVQAVDTTITTAGERSLALGTHYEVSGSTFALTADGFALFDSLAEGVDDSFVVNFKVSDGLEAVANTLSVTVEGANDAPRVTTLGFSADEDETNPSLDLLIGANDVDEGDVLSVQSVDAAITSAEGRELALGTHYTVTGSIAALTADGTSLFQSLAEGAEDSLVLHYEITDGIDAVANSLSLVVEGLNDAPTVEAVAGGVGEDGPSFAVDLLTGAGDVDDGDIVSVQAVDTTITTAGERSLVEGIDYVVDGAAFELTADGFAQFNSLAEGVNDSFVVNYSVSDGLVSVANTLTVTVEGANDAPVAANDQAGTDENTVVEGDVLANDGDPDFDPLTVTHVNATTNLGTQIALASGALLLLNANGTFAYDPNGQFDFLAEGETAEDSFTYTVADEHGTTDTATVTITVNGLNTAAVATASMVATNDGVAASGMLTGADAEGDTLTFSLEQDAANGTVVVNQDGSFTYTPDTEVTGADSFTYRVTDAHGGFDTATVAVDVAPLGAGEAPKNITGTDGNDVLIGSSLNDVLFGGLGNDVLRSGGAPQTFLGQDRLDGGPGDDTLIAEGGAAILVGGPGNDVLTRDVTELWYDFVRADYQSSEAGIVANFTAGTVDGLAPGEVADGFGTIDQVSNMHVILDSAHNDAFHVDETYSNGQSNFIEVRLSGGDDTVVFDNVGQARIGFGSAGGGVLADLETGTATDLDPNDNFIGSDTFSGKVHVLRGSHFNDELYGSSGNESFRGEGGDDYIDGRGGTNMLQFVSSPEAVHVDLSQNLVLNDGIWIEALGRHGTDEVHNIQNVSGSDWDDLIVGDAGNDRLFGGLGNDELRSGGAPQNFFGEDWLFGNEGDDMLTAEGGWVVLEGGQGNDVLTSEDQGGFWDFVRADYRSSPAGIEANLTGALVGTLAPGEVADGFGTVDTVSGVHLLADSAHGDMIRVDGSYLNSFGNWIEVRLSGGDDTVEFSNVNTARISYAQALGPVLLDMDLAQAKDKPVDYDPAVDTFADAVPITDFIGQDSFVGATQARGSRYDDVLYGRLEANDSLRGSGGDDYIDGRGGVNTITFGDSSSGIHVDLSQTPESRVLNDGVWIEALNRHGIDEVHNIQNVSGSVWSDVIIGDGGNNVLRSGGAPQDFFAFDRLEGLGGDDVLTAQGGGAVLVGGAGNDVLQSFDGGGWYDWVRADYTTSPGGIVANLTGTFINDLAPGDVTDGFGTLDNLAGADFQGDGPTGVHVLADSPNDDVIHVDGSYRSSFGNWIEVRLSGGNDTVNFNGVGGARISYQQALGPVLLDMDLAQAKDKPDAFDPAVDNFADAVPETNFIGNDTFAGANSARGSNFDDVLLGRFEFNDTFRGSGGDDHIDGRGGINLITFGDSSLGIHVDLSQNAVLDDGIFTDLLGRHGIDEVHNVHNVNGSDWDDLIIGDGGSNRLFGGLGNDELRSGGAPQEWHGTDWLDGGFGDDTLTAEGGGAILVGGPGNDVLTSTDDGSFWDFVLADYRSSPGAIVANLTGGTINDLASGEVADGFGTVDRVSNVHVLVDTSNNDFVYVDSTYTSSERNWIEVRLSGGNDAVTFTDVDFARISYSYAQGPVLIDLEAGTGTDLNELDNHVGDDTFTGATAARGSRFDDTILGREAGNDDLRGNAGDDLLDGRGGIDTISFAGAEAGIHVDLSQSPESRVLNDGHWNFDQGRYGIDEVHNVQNVSGSGWDDLIIGDGGNNVLHGLIGNDSLSGGLGDDTLVGGPGDDSMNGGEGADRFGYRSPDEGVDSIIDFAVSEDVLVIDASAFGGGLVAGQALSANQFVSGDAPEATEAHGQFLYDSVLGDLSWDVDGTGVQEAVQFANLAGAPDLMASDFELIDAGGSFVGSSEIAAAVDGGGEPVA